MRVLLVFIIGLTALSACAEPKPKTPVEEPAAERQLSILEFVTSDMMKQNQVKHVHQVITASPDYWSLPTHNRSAIYYDYYFDDQGRLEASRPGYSGTTYYNVFDENGLKIGYQWRDGYGGAVENEVIGDVAPYRMTWETTLADTDTSLAIDNPCYSVIADFKLEHTEFIESGLPTAGTAKFHSLPPGDDSMIDDGRKTLYVFYRYKFVDN